MKNTRCASSVRLCGLSTLLALCLFLVDLPLAAQDCVNCRRGDVSDGQPYTGTINTSDCTLGNGRRYEIVRYIKRAAGNVTFTTSGSCDTFMEVMNAGCGGIGSNTNCASWSALGINPQNSCLSGNLSAGTYYFCIFERTGANSCGSYTLTVTESEAPPAPANDTCRSAEEVTLEERSIGFGRRGLLWNGGGSTIAATPDSEDASCGPSNAPGVWYMVAGTGESMTVQTCGSTYDTRLSLFSGGLAGDCGALGCTIQNDDFCGLQSSVTWVSQVDVIYYILVHGWGSSSGTYTLSVQSAIPPEPADTDGDGVNDNDDNCVDDSNPGQEDCDGDGVGDACSEPCPVDTDGDGVNDDVDNCVDESNPGQEDCDGDGAGDACSKPCVVGPPSYSLGFAGCDEVSGFSGNPYSTTVDLVLRDQDNSSESGAQSWSVGVVAEGASITAITTEGTDAGGVVENSGFQINEITSGDGNEGAISAVVVSFVSSASLPPNASSSIATVTVEGSVGDADSSVSLAYREGLSGEGQPVQNVATWEGATIRPELGNCSFSVVPDVTPPAIPTGLTAEAGDGVVTLDWDDNAEGDFGHYSLSRNGSVIAEALADSAYTDEAVENGTTYSYTVTAADAGGNESDSSAAVEATPEALGGGQIPGDYNQDAGVDISDAISVFGYLFLGREDPVCPAGLDFNGDSALDLSDGIGALNWLFQGGPGHALGTGCVQIIDCQDSCN